MNKTKVENIKHLWTILCSNSSLDKESNNLSLFNLIEHIKVDIDSQAHAVHVKDKTRGFIINLNLDIISRLIRIDSGASESIEVEVDYNNPSGETILKRNDVVFVEKNIKNIRLINKINSLPVENTGLYNFVVKIKEATDKEYKNIGSVPLEIVVNLPIK